MKDDKEEGLEDLREVHRELERLAPGKWVLVESYEDHPARGDSRGIRTPCIWLKAGGKADCPEVNINLWNTYSFGSSSHYKGIEVNCRDGRYWQELSGIKKVQGYSRRKDDTFNVAALLRFVDGFVEVYLNAVKRKEERKSGEEATKVQLRKVLKKTKREDSFGHFGCRKNGTVDLALRRSSVNVPVEKAGEVLEAWLAFLAVVGEGE
jgi:hypothetical protein